MELFMKQGGGGGRAGRLGDDVLVQGKMTDRGEHLVVSDEDDFVDEFADGAHVIGFGDARREAVGNGVACFGGDGLALLPGEEVGRRLLGACTPMMRTVGDKCLAIAAMPRMSAVSPMGTTMVSTEGSCSKTSSVMVAGPAGRSGSVASFRK